MGIIVSSCLNEHEAEAVIPVDRVRRVFYGIASFRFAIPVSVLALLPPSPFSLPVFSDALRLCVQGLKCPVCSKFILPDDIECHLVMCLTKPRLSYNGK